VTARGTVGSQSSGGPVSSGVDWPFVLRVTLPVVAVMVAATALLTALSREWTAFDLTVYLEAGRRLASGMDPYAFSMPPIDALYRYSPMFAVLMAPLSGLPLPVVAFAWRLVAFGLLGLSVRGLGWVGVIILFNPLVVFDLLVANVSTLFLAAMITVVRWPSARTVAGYALLVVLVPKPTLLPVLAWGLWRVAPARLPVGLVAALGVATLAIPGYAPAVLSGSHIFGLMQNLQALSPMTVYVALSAAACLTIASTRWPRLLGPAAVLATPYYFDYGWMLILLALVPAGTVAAGPMMAWRRPRRSS